MIREYRFMGGGIADFTRAVATTDTNIHHLVYSDDIVTKIQYRYHVCEVLSLGARLVLEAFVHESLSNDDADMLLLDTHVHMVQELAKDHAHRRFFDDRRPPKNV